MSTGDPDGTWPSFFVAFQANNTDAALTAWDQWGERAQAVNGLSRIVYARLRGSDGTDKHYFDEDLHGKRTRCVHTFRQRRARCGTSG
jgi:hypothetical protein